MKARLDQPNARSIHFRGALVSGFHQTAADGPILRRGIDGDRAETSDRIAFVQKIAADDAPVDLSDNGIKLGWLSIHVNKPIAISGDGKSGAKLCASEIVLNAL